MNWDIVDFTVFGAMLLGVGVAFAFVRRKSDNTTYRIAMGIALAAAFILVWVNGAVGIIGNENNDANMLYLGVLAVGIIGAIIARFRPGGMARVMGATALAQVIVAVIALMAGWGSTAPAWPNDILVLTGFFVALWLLSAYLFKRAARGPAPAAA
jgi:uncharacterized membrane protein